jgi:DNA-binding response OmpR family regulator
VSLVTESPRRNLVALIDTDKMVAEMYAFGLGERGFRVTIHRSSAELFATLGSDPPDLVVIDWVLPGGGAAILAAIRADERIFAVPILILTAVGPSDSERDLASENAVAGWHEKMHTPPAMLADALAALA